jgi:hypothetical protein
MKINQFTEEEINALKDQFYYNPETGELFRIFKCKIKKIATFAKGGRYLTVYFLGKTFCVHRIAWAIYYGTNPKEQIDHINRIKTDNRISNLREASNLQNQLNKTHQKNSKTGKKGVHYDKQTNKWRASICFNGKQTKIGRFLTKEEAVLAYQAKAKELHGEFYRP